MVLYYTVTTFYVIICLLLLLVILLHQGKGGDMASAFGGGSSQTAFGARGGATVLSKATAVLAALFMIGAMALAIVGQRGPGSLVSGTPAPRPLSPPPGIPATPRPITPGPAVPAGTPAQPAPAPK
jgi:preprotein translocase subunit SecG